MTVESTLVERGTNYGNYLKQCKISHKLKTAMAEVDGYYRMEVDQQDALELMAVKISRILNGNPNYVDNWTDIAGYATLVADRLSGNERP